MCGKNSLHSDPGGSFTGSGENKMLPFFSQSESTELKALILARMELIKIELTFCRLSDLNRLNTELILLRHLSRKVLK